MGVGIGQSETVEFTTAEGSVKLPVDFQKVDYMPTTTALAHVTRDPDTRRQNPPLRYYK
jgi:hypothetical protein